MSAPSAVPKVGIVCDLREEQWPSMDLVAEMLLASLGRDQADGVEAVEIRPPMRRRLSLGTGERAPGSTGAGLRFNADRGLNRFWDYPRYLRRRHGDLDLFHVVDHAYAHLAHWLPRGRAIVTCHDLHTFQCLLEPTRQRRSAGFRAMTRYVLDGLRKAARVVVDASPVRDDLVRHGIVQADRVAVVHLGVHPAFLDEPGPAAEAEARRRLASDGESLDVLHVGGTFARKRIDLLLRVFARARMERPELRLVRVGGELNAEQRRLAADLGVADAIHTLPFLERDVLAAVYRRVAALLLPSEEEGFGLPVLEAMACGVPVLASDLPVLREIGGDVASYRPVGDIKGWTDSFNNLLTERSARPVDWAARRRRGTEHARRFTWAEYGRKMTSIYREVLNQ